MEHRIFFKTVALLFMAVVGCTASRKTVTTMSFPYPDFQGHRGARGLLPENTIPSMFKAIDLGATTLELDVVISRDKKVVVSHEAYFHENITTAPDGKALDKNKATSLLLYAMDYDSIRKYDVGLKPHPGFAQQQKMPAYKPLLTALIDSCEAYAAQMGKGIFYNIEIKSDEAHDGSWHPAPPEFAELVMKVIQDKGIAQRTNVQSFDVRPLQYLHQHYPSIRLAYLVGDTSEPLDVQLQHLGFIPAVYSPHYKNLTQARVDEAHAKGMKVVPWTVNTLEEMQRLMVLKVDGIISDYPNLFTQLRTASSARR